jgi:hypothetical protein
MTRDEQIADWIENIGGSFVMSEHEAVLLPRKACEMIALMLRNGDCRPSDEDIDRMALAASWRRCAKGQRVTQHCALLEAAVKAEREAYAKIVEAYCGAWHDEGYALAQAIRARREI